MVFLCTLISVLVMLPILLFLLSLKVFPGDLLPSDPAIENEAKNRTELERRNSYMSTLESKLGEGHGPSSRSVWQMILKDDQLPIRQWTD